MIRERQRKGFIEGCLSIKCLKDLETYVYGSLTVINTSFDLDLYFLGKKLVWTEHPNFFVWTVWAAGYQQGIEDVQCTSEVLQPVNHKSRLSTKFVNIQGLLQFFVQCWNNGLVDTMKNGMVSHVSDVCWNVTAITAIQYCICCIIHMEIIMFAKETITSETKSPHNRLLRLYWWMYQQPTARTFPSQGSLILSVQLKCWKLQKEDYSKRLCWARGCLSVSHVASLTKVDGGDGSQHQKKTKPGECLD